MPRIDMAHAVSISSPLSSDLVVTTPRIPGLEVHLAKGSVIRDHEGRPATQIGITAIPVDRTPFPLPTGVDVPVYFTIQPGGGFIETPNAPWPAGARVVYPNLSHEGPGTEIQFWNYDPEDRGWHVYGQGTVDPAGGQVVPHPGVVIYRFTGTMINVPGMTPPADGPLSGELEKKYGPLPSILATRGDFVQDYEKKESLLSRAYAAAVAIGDHKNALYIAHSMTELYMDELVSLEEARQWLDRLDRHLLDIHDSTYADDAEKFRRQLNQLEGK